MMWTSIVCMFLLTLSTGSIMAVHGVMPQASFGQMPLRVEVSPGENAEIPCPVHNLGTQTIIWYREGQAAPLSIGSFIYTPNPRMMVSVTTTNNVTQSTLRFRGVDQSDAGVYFCHVGNREFTRTSPSVQLAVQRQIHGVTPQASFGQMPLRVEVSPGENAEIPCPVHNLGTQTIIWYREGQAAPVTVGSFVYTSNPRMMVSVTNTDDVTLSTLRFRGVNQSDAGVYFCHVSSPTFTRTSPSVQLIVQRQSQSDTGSIMTKREVTAQASFGQMPSRVEVSQGENAEIPCPVHNLGRQTIVWFREGQAAPLSVGSFVYTPNPRMMVSLTNTDDVTLSTLRFRGVNQSDAGVYFCHVDNREIELELTSPSVQLAVQGQIHGVTPQPYFGEMPVRVEVSPGENAEIPCPVHNMGRQTIVWLKEGQSDPLSVDSSIFTANPRMMVSVTNTDDVILVTLKFRVVDQSDAGVYFCLLSSREFELGSPPVQLVVQRQTTIMPVHGVTPQTSFGQMPLRVDVSPGENAEIPCPVHNLGTQTILWFREGQEVPLSVGMVTFTRNRRLIVTMAKTDDVIQSTLRFRGVNQSDTGVYFCMMSSQSDVTSQRVQLVVQSSNNRRPVLAGMSWRVEAHSGESAEIPCPVRKLGENTVAWFKRDRERPLSVNQVLYTSDSHLAIDVMVTDDVTQYTLRFPAVNSSDAGLYFCEINMRGRYIESPRVQLVVL